jgi:hypothetical protein
MSRPIETLLALPRVKLTDRVPIIETQAYIHRAMNQNPYQMNLINRALQVSGRSAKQFSNDDQGLTTLLSELNSNEYAVTKHSVAILQNLINDICSDGFIYREFENEIEPLTELSEPLRQTSKLAGNLADKTREETFDLAHMLLIAPPKRGP